MLTHSAPYTELNKWYPCLVLGNNSLLPPPRNTSATTGRKDGGGFSPLEQGTWLLSTISWEFHITKSCCCKDLAIAKDFGATVNFFLWPITAMAFWLLLSLRPKGCSREVLGILRPVVWEMCAQHTLWNLLESCSKTTWPDNTKLGLKTRWSFPVLPG